MVRILIHWSPNGLRSNILIMEIFQCSSETLVFLASIFLLNKDPFILCYVIHFTLEISSAQHPMRTHTPREVMTSHDLLLCTRTALRFALVTAHPSAQCLGTTYLNAFTSSQSSYCLSFVVPTSSYNLNVVFDTTAGRRG